MCTASHQLSKIFVPNTFRDLKHLAPSDYKWFTITQISALTMTRDNLDVRHFRYTALTMQWPRRAGFASSRVSTVWYNNHPIACRIAFASMSVY